MHVQEIKGWALKQKDKEGNIYKAGSYKILETGGENGQHNIYITRNGNLLGWIDVQDEIRPEAKSIIDWLHSKQIKTVLLSGDRQHNAIWWHVPPGST